MNGKELSFYEFCDALISDGVYQSKSDNHLYKKDGKAISRQMRNGYYTVRKMYNKHVYCFMEHRIVWYMHNGVFDESLQINHIDFDRTNNAIENLELLTSKENIRYTIDNGRANYCKGSESPKAAFTEIEVKLIRFLRKNGWNTEEVRSLFDCKVTETTIRRVVNGSRYGNVLDSADIMAIYPLIVEKTSRKDLLYTESIQNALLGIVGESGELVDLFKKYFYHNHDLDVVHVLLEIGDVIYYLCWLSNLLGLDFSEVMFANMQKLDSRYPEGFSEYASQHRKEGDI